MVSIRIQKRNSMKETPLDAKNAIFKITAETSSGIGALTRVEGQRGTSDDGQARERGSGFGSEEVRGRVHLGRYP